MNNNNKKLYYGLALVAAGALLVAYGVFNLNREAAAPGGKNEVKPANSTEKKPETVSQTAFDKTKFSTEDPASLWVVVNKKRPLPAGFVPGDLAATGGVQLKADAKGALEELFENARQQGVQLKPVSGYRSYATQQNVYNSYVRSDGQAAADTYSARAGHSEHQTGLAVDVGNGDNSCNLEICFGGTPGGQWVAQNAYKYGFTVSYPEGKTAVTGYQYEPWHIRYVGKELAAELYKESRTMGEFFGLPAAPGY